MLKTVGRMELRRLSLFRRMITHDDGRSANVELKNWAGIDKSFHGVSW